MDVNDNLAAAFEALTGYVPLKWQSRLFDRLATGNTPARVTLPTGLGKTAIIPIWLIALAHPARSNGAQPPLPRRLVYVVNRRTVVDQATDAAERIRQIIANPSEAEQLEGAACRLRDALTKMSGDRTGVPLAVSTLRGELADNGEWKQNPARPAIIIGTVDMIGSKLVFSGYGDGRYGRAHHAGLIGQDALIVHDEAHLSPAFDALLRTAATEQGRCKEARPLRVMSLSATTRAASGCATAPDSMFGVEDEDRKDALVEQRLKATKSLKYVETEKDKLDAEIARNAVALGEAPSRVLVYVRSPATAAKVAREIQKKLGSGGDARVALLTGTIRGYERDALAKGPILTAFWSNPHRELLAHSMFLVSTSAGEVGADFDADHLVCDLTPLDSMIQRLGRVNRLGGWDREARIVVVVQKLTSDGDEAGEGKPKKGKGNAGSAYDAAVVRTGALIRTVASNGWDVSPAAIGRLIAGLSDDDKRAAFSPAPTILPATDILFDACALTSISGVMPGRPMPEPYLHGVADWEPPETHVAWRADIALLAAAGSSDDNGADVPCSHDELEQIFESFPLRSVEQLRDRTEHVQAELRKIAERLKDDAQRRTTSAPAGDTYSDEPSGTGDEDESGDDAANKMDKPIDPNPWVVLMRGGAFEWMRLEEIAPPDNDHAKRAQRRLAFATVVLPLEAGGLTKAGILDGNQRRRDGPAALDVAEMTVSGQARQRVRLGAATEPSSTGGANSDDEETSKRTERPLLGGEVVAGLVPRLRIPLSTPAKDQDAEPETLEYRVAKGEAREPGKAVALEDHCNAVATAAARMARAVGLDELSINAITLAGKLHDLGKARTIWQRYARNGHAGARPLAKADKGRYLHPKVLGGYRHEFGSLHDAAADREIQALDADTRDLVLHLIAAHHGWARPHFESRHFDPGDPGKSRPTAENEGLAVEAMQRFVRLQQRYGRWGLAWLESILRCADAAASQGEPSRDREGAGSAGSAGLSGTGVSPVTATPGGAA